MTLEQIQALTDDEIRVRVAEICGWVRHGCYWLKPGSRNTRRLLDYPADLNACHEFERMMNGPESVSYGMLLSKLQVRDLITEPCDRYPKAATVHEWHASARARCEAFLATMGKEAT